MHLYFTTVSAWDVLVHHQIGRIADHIQHSEPDENHNLQKRTHDLLKGKIVDSVAYGHTHFETNPKLKGIIKPLHFQQQRPQWSCDLGTANKLPTNMIRKYKPCNNGEDNHCLLSAMYWSFDRFAHTELLNYQKHFHPPISPIKELEKWRKLEFPPSHEMRWLLNLLGDLHQPLHFGNIEDNYGKNIKVSWKGKVLSFFEYWESVLPSEFYDNSNMDEHVAKLKGKSVKTEPDTFFADWAAESQKLSCEVYGILGLGKSSPWEKSKTYTITREMHDKMEAIMQTQILRAAERTALVILNILEHKHHKERHEEGRPKTAHHHKEENFLVNLCIAAVYFPIFSGFIYLLEKKSTKFIVVGHTI